MSCYLAPDGLMSTGYPGHAFELAMERVCDCGHAERLHIIGSVHRCLAPECLCMALRFLHPISRTEKR